MWDEWVELIPVVDDLDFNYIEERLREDYVG